MSALVLDDTQREVLDLQEAFRRIAPRLTLAEAWEFTGRFFRLRKAVGLPALMVVGGAAGWMGKRFDSEVKRDG